MITKLKLKLLKKNREKYKKTVEQAFYKVRFELIQFLREYKKEPDVLIKYLSQCVQTDDVLTFISFLEGVIEEANKCEGDLLAKLAKYLCKYTLLRLSILSRFTLGWTNVTVKCQNCGRRHRHNYLYSNKLCPYCGHIVKFLV